MFLSSVVKRFFLSKSTKFWEQKVGERNCLKPTGEKKAQVWNSDGKMQGKFEKHTGLNMSAHMLNRKKIISETALRQYIYIYIIFPTQQFPRYGLSPILDFWD